MKKKLLLDTPPCPVPGRCSIKKVVAVSQTLYIEDRQILNVDMFFNGNLQARYFADDESEEYATFVYAEKAEKKHQGWGNIKLENTARVIQGKEIIPGYYYMGNELIWESKEDEQKQIYEGNRTKTGENK